MEFDGTVEKVFGSFAGRVTLNKQNAELQISDLNSEDSGRYESEIQLKGKRVRSSHELVVLGEAHKFPNTFKTSFVLINKFPCRILFASSNINDT